MAVWTMGGISFIDATYIFYLPDDSPASRHVLGADNTSHHSPVHGFHNDIQAQSTLECLEPRCKL